MSVRFEVRGGERLRAGFEALGDQAARVKFLRDSALLVEAEAKANVSGEVLNVRSGKGRASITTDVSDAPRSFSVGAPGETGRYLGAHETGSTIVPRRAKVLTIPLDAAKTAAGVPRWSAREAPFEDTFWRRTRAGNLILFGKNRGEPIVPLFLGVAQVTLPQRRWLLPAFEETNQAREELLVKRLEERLAAAS